MLSNLHVKQGFVRRDRTMIEQYLCHNLSIMKKQDVRVFQPDFDYM